MRTVLLVAMAVLRSLAIGLATIAKIIVVFHWTTVRDISIAIGEELRAAASADADDWRR